MLNRYDIPPLLCFLSGLTLTYLLYCSSSALPVCLSLSLSLSVCLCLCLSVCLSVSVTNASHKFVSFCPWPARWWVWPARWWAWPARWWAWLGRCVGWSLGTCCYGNCMCCHGSSGRLSLSVRAVTVWAAPSLLSRTNRTVAACRFVFYSQGNSERHLPLPLWTSDQTV